jgi:hypothetical protein
VPTRGPVAQRLGRLRDEILAALAWIIARVVVSIALVRLRSHGPCGCWATGPRGPHDAYARRTMVAALSQPLATDPSPQPGSFSARTWSD